MQKAIFLDRDGVLNREVGTYICTPEELDILPGVGEALKHWQDQGYIFIVVTNQAGISKGLYSHETLQSIHKKLENYLADFGVYLKEIYYSPYHPDYCNSLNRKPDSLMLEKALAKYNISAPDSYMIGDRDRDALAAEKVGVESILIESNTDLRTVFGRIR